MVVIASFASEEEAIDAANNTTYGLGSAVFTNDLKRAHRVAAEIDAGMVWINSTQDCDPRIPFGGEWCCSYIQPAVANISQESSSAALGESWDRLDWRLTRRLRRCT